MDEIYQNKLTNEESAKLILSRGYKDAYITCDSAEPKSSADYRAMGLPAKEANQRAWECGIQHEVASAPEDRN